MWEGYFFLGICTNNQAEYQGLVEGLKAATEKGMNRLRVQGDSQLVIRQMKGEYAVKNEALRAPYREAKTLASSCDECHFEHVERSLNSIADRLANVAMDERRSHQEWLTLAGALGQAKSG